MFNTRILDSRLHKHMSKNPYRLYNNYLCSCPDKSLNMTYSTLYYKNPCNLNILFCMSLYNHYHTSPCILYNNSLYTHYRRSLCSLYSILQSNLFHSHPCSLLYRLFYTPFCKLRNKNYYNWSNYCCYLMTMNYMSCCMSFVEEHWLPVLHMYLCTQTDKKLCILPYKKFCNYQSNSYHNHPYMYVDNLLRNYSYSHSMSCYMSIDTHSHNLMGLILPMLQ